MLVGEDTRVLVGHSLGSVAAYKAAHRLDWPLPLLVTLRSRWGGARSSTSGCAPNPGFPLRASRLRLLVSNSPIVTKISLWVVTESAHSAVYPRLGPGSVELLDPFVEDQHRVLTIGWA